MLLIDSILIGIDIPKIYLHRVGTANQWDCIDGHQRIDAIIGFFDGEFTYYGKKFDELSQNQKNTIEKYKLTIVEVTEVDVDEEEVRLLFRRLQLGIPLNSGEKLNAIKSNMGDFVKIMAESAFIKKINIPERRFAKEQVCAQICNNSIAINKTGQFRNSKYEDLENLYRIFKDFDLNSEPAKHILSILEKTNEIFLENARKIRNRASAVSIFLLVEEMVLGSEIQGKERIMKRFYVDFLDEIQREVRKGINFSNRFLIKYQSRIIQGADTKGSITERHRNLKEAFEYYSRNKMIIGAPAQPAR